MTSHIAVAMSLCFDIMPKLPSHQELLFYGFTLITTGLSQNMVDFHMRSFTLYE